MLDPWLSEHLCCPRDTNPLRQVGDSLVCPDHHTYPVIDGVPVMLLDDAPGTDDVFADTFRVAARKDPPRTEPPVAPLAAGEVDPIVQSLVAGSCGVMYRPLIGNLKRYPIPHLHLPPSDKGVFLDIGCAWGRWSLAAAGKGYRAVGIDPSIRNIFAARRIARQLGRTGNIYIVADGRYLPFRSNTFDAAFSYSCLQHMSHADVALVLQQFRRTLKPAGVSLVELPNRFGLRNLYILIKRRFRAPTHTEVRYWRPRDMVAAFTEHIGPTRLDVDGYFTINPQISDLDLLPFRYKPVVLASELLRKLSAAVPGLYLVADSLYVRSCKGASDPLDEQGERDKIGVVGMS